MDNDIILSADSVALFCRLQMNMKRELPIRPSEMGVLIFTQQHNLPVTPLMISNFFKITKPSVTTMINSLVKNKYLVKIPSQTDGRSYILSTTKLGSEIVAATYNEYFRTMELLKKEMGEDEFHNLISLIQKANIILSKEKE